MSTKASAPSAGMHIGGFRPDIEGLRAVAILLVVAYHVGYPQVSGGFIGVDVFFVLSGYLITGLLLDEVSGAGRLSFVRFYARRVRRLLPGFALSFVGTLAIATRLLAPVEIANLRRTAIGAAAYAGNVVFARLDFDYFAGAATTNPFLHVWSLAVEEQFYVVWPLLVLVAVLVGRRFGSPPRGVLVIAGLATLTSLALSIVLTRREPIWAFYASPSRLWEFGAGAIAVVLPPLARRRRAAAVLGVVGIALVVLAAAAFDEDTALPGIAAVLPVAGTAAVLAAGSADGGGGPLHWLRSRPMQYLGARSYGWYLWHWPLLLFAKAVDSSMALPGRTLVAAGALGVAAISHRLVEGPIRSSPTLIRRPWLSLAMGAALTVGTVGTAIATTSWARSRADQPDQQRFLAALALPELYGEGCGLGFLDVDTPTCVFGDPNGEETIVLFGDSHAGHWFPALDRIARERGARLVTYVKDACPTAAVEVYSEQLGRTFDECTEWRRETVAAIVDSKPALVVTSNSSSDVRSPSRPAGRRLPLDEWTKGLAATANEITAAGVPFALITDTPRAQVDVTTCLSRRAWSGLGPSCEYERAGSRDEGLSAGEAEAIEGIRGTTFVDMADAICSSPVCPVEIDGVILLRDSNHLTVAFSEQLAHALRDRLPLEDRE